jgi:hypothetical protein
MTLNEKGSSFHVALLITSQQKLRQDRLQMVFAGVTSSIHLGWRLPVRENMLLKFAGRLLLPKPQHWLQ